MIKPTGSYTDFHDFHIIEGWRVYCICEVLGKFSRSQNRFSKLWTTPEKNNNTGPPASFFFGCPEGEHANTITELDTSTEHVHFYRCCFVFFHFFLFFLLCFVFSENDRPWKPRPEKWFLPIYPKDFRHQKRWNSRDLGKEISSLQENGQIEKWQAGLIFFGTFTINNIFCKIWSLLPEDADTSPMIIFCEVR